VTDLWADVVGITHGNKINTRELTIMWVHQRNDFITGIIYDRHSDDC